MVRLCWRSSAGCFIYSFNSSDQCKKTLCTKGFSSNLRFLHQNNHNYNSYRFSYKFVFILFLSFLTSQKQGSSFQKSWWSGNDKYCCFLFIVSRALLKSHAVFDRLYKGIFLYVILVCIVAPYLSVIVVPKKWKNIIYYYWLVHQHAVFIWNLL